MNKMQVTLSIDLDNTEQTDAMKAFMDTLSGGEAPTKKLRKTTAADDEDQDDDEDDAEEKKKAAARERARKSREAKKKKEAAAAAKKAAEEEDEDDEDFDDLDDEEAEIDLATLRTLTAKKVKASTANRDAIKKKLAKLKVKNVSSLEEDDFQEYHDFITAL